MKLFAEQVVGSDANAGVDTADKNSRNVKRPDSLKRHNALFRFPVAISPPGSLRRREYAGRSLT